MYALDTNTLIYFFKGQGQVAAHLLSRSPETIAVPAIVQYDIETGIVKSDDAKQRTRQFHDFLEIVTILPFDSKAALESAHIRADLERQGTPIGPYDILIAGTALTHDATLVTHNRREFSRVEHLNIED